MDDPDAPPIDLDQEVGDLRSHVIACRHRWASIYKLVRQQNRILYVLAGAYVAGQFAPKDGLLALIKVLIGG